MGSSAAGPTVSSGTGDLVHSSVMDWTRTVVARNNLADLSVLEVGSQNVNGSVRTMFRGPYIGCDFAPGFGVDVVADAQDLSRWGDGEFDVVISTEMLEHCERPWIAVKEMARVSNKWVILTARGYDQRGCWPPHGYPHDFYRFSAESMTSLARDAGLIVDSVEADLEGPGWLLVAKKSH